MYSKFNFGIAQNTRTKVETQLIDLSPLTVPEFSFWYHMFGAGIGDLIVEIPFDVLKISVPLIIYFVLMFFTSFFIGKAMNIDYKKNASIAFTASPIPTEV